MKKLLLLLLFLPACTTVSPAEHTVMITNLAETSGGSGSIIESSPTSSTILTNRHVCGVVENGGLVHSGQTEALVVSYRQSARHDLCVIKVASYLGPATKLASEMPEPLMDIQVSGHPKLMPIIISKGHMSGRQIIDVMVGVRACTDLEKKNPNLDFACKLLGKLPIIRHYEADAISATVQPGSSGSGVYNLRGEIVAVVFASQGDFGYGFTVPFEHIYAFLNTEVQTLQDQYPNLIVQYETSADERTALISFRNECAKNAKAAKFCKTLLGTSKDDMIFRSN